MKQKIFEIVKSVILELNEEWEYAQFSEVTEETGIFGGGGAIDSLSLVMLVTEIESEVNEQFDANVLLASEKAMSMRNSPYNSVSSLMAFIEGELQG